MGQCQDDVQSLITPAMQNDDKKMKKVEDSLVKCSAGAIEKSREGLKPMRQRIESQLELDCVNVTTMFLCVGL
jgi:hypothetical protein